MRERSPCNYDVGFPEKPDRHCSRGACTFLSLPGSFLSVTDLDWPRLGQYVRARRIQIGFKGRDAFAEKAGIGSRTIGQVERGLPVGDNSLYALEHALMWRNGSIRSILTGGEPEISDPRFAGLYPIRVPHAGSDGKQTVTEENPGPEDEVDQASVGDAAEDGRYVAHRSPGDPPAGGLSDAEVLALIRENRRLADELERRILRDGPVEGAS